MDAVLVGALGYSFAVMMAILGAAGAEVTFKRVGAPSTSDEELFWAFLLTIGFFALSFGAASATYLILR
jgi:hypothetical protein